MQALEQVLKSPPDTGPLCRCVGGWSGSMVHLQVKQWWTNQHRAQQVVLNNRQKAPRRKTKLEFDSLWAFPQERGAKELTADGGRLSWGKPSVWGRSSKYKTNTFKPAFRYGWLILKSWAGFSWVFNVCSAYWFQPVLVQARLFQKGWSSCCAEHKTLTACLGSLPLSALISSYLLPYPCIVMPSGQDYLLCCDKDPGCAWCL